MRVDQSRLGLGVVALLARCSSLDPFQAVAVRSQPYLIRQHRHFDIEESGQTLRQHRIAEHQTHFGVEPRRALVEIERADEDPLAVDGERLGMQAGGRA